MKNKYQAQKCVIDGKAFDSIKESKRYRELLLLEKAGVIHNLQRQVKYELIPAQYRVYKRYGKNGRLLKDGKKLLEHNCTYIADFVYEMDGNTIVEDTKGVRTTDYIIKRKLMLYVHGIAIKEV
jgi:hypothetical protein